MKKYLLTILMAMLTLSLSFGLALTASAEDETPTPDAAFTAFKTAIEEAATDGTVTEIALTENFTVTEKVTFKKGASYVLYSEKDVTVTLGNNMTDAPMFFIATDAGVSVTFGKSTTDAGTVTYNGNKGAFEGKTRTDSGLLAVEKANKTATAITSTVVFNKATVKDFVTNESNGAAMTFFNTNVTINDMVLDGNEKRNISTDTSKNGIIYLNGCTVTVNGGTFKNNVHEGTGGSVMYFAGTSVNTINGGLFENNKSTNVSTNTGYGAIYVNGAKATLNVFGGEFKNNSATNGGAIAVKAAKKAVIDGTKEGKTLSFDGNTAKYLGGDVAVFGSVACEITGDSLNGKDVYLEKNGKIHLMYNKNEVTATQAAASDLYYKTEGLGIAGSFFFADADNYLTYRAIYPAGAKNVGASFRITGGGLKVEYRNVNSDTYTAFTNLSNNVEVWQTYFVDNSALNENLPTEIEYKFSDATPADGGGTQVHDFKFVQASSSGKVINVNAPRVSADLINDISESFSYGNAGGKPFADGYAFYAYNAKFAAGSTNAGMILTVNGAQDNIYVGYSVNGGDFTEVSVITGQESKVVFEGLDSSKENNVTVKFYAKLKQGGGPYLQSMVFVKDGKTHTFGNETTLDLGNSAENLFADNGSAVAGPVRYVDGEAYMTYRVTFPANTKVAKAVITVGGTNAEAGETPKVEYRNVLNETFTAAILQSNLAIQQTIDFGGILNSGEETTVEVKISDPSTSNGGGTQLMGIIFKKNIFNDKLITFGENETRTIDLMNDIDEGMDFGNAGNTPFADCEAFYSYRVEFPSNAYNPYVKLTVNGGNASVRYTVNNGEYKEIAVENGVEATINLEGFISAQKNVLTIVFGAKDKTAGNGANLKAIEFGFTDAETVITGISLDKTTAEIEEAGTLTLKATVTGGSKIDNTVTWTSNNEEIATVENGVVTALKVGTATITATTADGKTATCTVTVKAKAVKPDTSGSSNEESTEGCLGSIGATSALVSVIGFAVIALKKRKKN